MRSHEINAVGRFHREHEMNFLMPQSCEIFRFWTLNPADRSGLKCVCFGVCVCVSLNIYIYIYVWGYAEASCQQQTVVGFSQSPQLDSDSPDNPSLPLQHLFCTCGLDLCSGGWNAPTYDCQGSPGAFFIYKSPNYSIHPLETMNMASGWDLNVASLQSHTKYFHLIWSVTVWLNWTLSEFPVWKNHIYDE